MNKPTPNDVPGAEARQMDRSLLQPGDAADERVAEVLSRPCQFVAIVGENSAAKDHIVETVLADPQTRAICVANPLAATLTLARIMFQIDADYVGTGPDDPTSFVQALLAHSAGESRLILIVKDAQTLDRQVLLALQDLPEADPPGSPNPQVLFLGLPAFHTLLEGDHLARLRERLTIVPIDTQNIAPLRLIEHIAPSTADGPETGVVRISPVAGGTATDAEPIRTNRRPWILGTTIVLAGALVVFAVSNDRPVDPTNTSVHPQPAKIIAPMSLSAPELSSSGQTEPTASLPEIISVPDRATEKPLIRDSPRERLRREFDEFLNRAGRDTAKLTDAQRQALFNEFVEWRSLPSKAKPPG